MPLLKKKCIPCEGGAKPLNREEISEFQKELKSHWSVIEERKIQKEFVFDDFKKAIAFVNDIADCAEREGHHPDIYIMYNKVVIDLWTHAIEGLSENDFILAAKIESLHMTRGK